MENLNVACVKIHPAIGVARLANNDDYFEFFEANSRKFSPAKDYMSAGSEPNPSQQRMKKQAVQFKLFAYDENNHLLGELKNILSDISIHWSANVSNRKLFNYSSKRGGNTINPISAQATATTPNGKAQLNGKNPWNGNETINLGSISGDGLFIPGKGGVTRKSSSSSIAPYPANQRSPLECTDTSCDGEISVEIFNASGNKLTIPVLPAWIVVAPSQHALTLTPVIAEEMGNNFGEFEPRMNGNQNKGWIQATSNLLGISGTIHDPTGMDTPMMETINADYNPGMEMNIGDIGRMENGIQPQNLFYPRGTGFIATNEIRIQPSNTQTGAKPGQITSGLCSTWQGDMVACLNYWTAENPKAAYRADKVKMVIYEEGKPNTSMSSPEQINEWMDFRGIVDYEMDGDDIKLNLVYDPNRPAS